MTLSELINSTTVQGNVRVSVWGNNGYGHGCDDELAVLYICNSLRLNASDFNGKARHIDSHLVDASDWLDYEITYIYYGNDSYLHIELEGAGD